MHLGLSPTGPNHIREAIWYKAVRQLRITLALIIIVYKMQYCKKNSMSLGSLTHRMKTLDYRPFIVHSTPMTSLC